MRHSRVRVVLQINAVLTNTGIKVTSFTDTKNLKPFIDGDLSKVINLCGL